jgi:glycosyltransferase involved in cell wall biosynthesis
MGASWPPVRAPSRLARGLRDDGWEVIVPTRPALDEAIAPLRLVIWLLAAAARSPRALLTAFRSAGHVSGIRARVWWLYRSLPALARRSDAVFVAARAEAEPYAVLGAAHRLVAVAESPLPHPNRPEPRVERLLSTAAEVWCVTETEREAAKAHGASEVVVRAPTVAAAQPRRSVEPGRIACTTPLDWAGGQTYALAALRQVLDRGIDVRLALAAEGPDRERVLFTIADLYLGDRVELGGAELGRAAVFVLPAVYDGAWPEALDARAAGIPVVASRLPGLADLDAVFVPPRDPAALADALGPLVVER